MTTTTAAPLAALTRRRCAILACMVWLIGTGGSAPAGQGGRTLHLPAPPHPDAIGTQVDGINTYVRSVTLSPPASVHRLGLVYTEIHGMIRGVGWGGRGPTGQLTCHYEYDLPYVLRIPAAWSGGLVIYRHGLASVAQWVEWETTLGDRNFGRIFHLSGDKHLSDAALHDSRRWAYFAVNQTPVLAGGVLNTTYFEGQGPECPVTQRVQTLQDVPIARDHALLAQHLLTVLRGRTPTFTIGTSHSAGGSVNLYLNAGIDRRTGTPLQVGDNHRRPYEPASGRIHDGFLLVDPGPVIGGPGLGPVGAVSASDLHGLSAPTLFLCGDASGVSCNFAVNQINQMVLAGTLHVPSLAGLYSVRNVSHLDADFVWSQARQGIDFADDQYFGGGGERLKPVTGALLDALARWVTGGVPPPASLFNGEVLTNPDRIEFYRTSPPADRFPYVDDEDLDTDTRAPGPPAAAIRTAWANARVALGAPVGSIVLPETACRRGSLHFTAGPTGTWFVPFTDEAFITRWGTQAAYQSCRVQTADALVAAGFYDATVVTVDIQPDRFPNQIQAGSSGPLQVAIFSTASFDATQIVPGSLGMASASAFGTPGNEGGARVRHLDVDGDGREDLVAEFRLDRLRLAAGDMIIDVWGRTRGGVEFSGSDVVQVVD